MADVALNGGEPPCSWDAPGGDLDGQLNAFGDNLYGQLGSTTNNGTENPNPTPTLVTLPGATGPVTEVAAGDGFSPAGTSTGQLYAFGYNGNGRLGSATNNGTGDPNPTPTLVTLPGPVKKAEVACKTESSAGEYSGTKEVTTSAPGSRAANRAARNAQRQD